MNISEHSEESRRIVVGVDGSPASYEALRWAVQQARLTGAKLEAWGAYDVPGAVGWSAPAVDAAFDAGQARQAVSDEIRAVIDRTGDVQLEEHVARGNPASVLTEASVGADLLVVGSRGRGGFASLLLGSVSQQCAVHASCPVVIVRPGTTAEGVGSDT
ncbi:universal stress protein [Streptomyces sp. SKN60]|uniref:universal stress protein n=1 Tax=Streptomyces sp. SKN60 TaxID=2855506 RepID=UPI00224658FB|nr:universal stress protein [Streptomyces sp. SKN60]MCX2182688.1 universal stress protein [Streptomyces sp. SKN60]